MPSINQLFGNPAIEDESSGIEFDMDAFLSAADEKIISAEAKNHSVLNGETVSPEATSAGEVAGSGVDDESGEAGGVASTGADGTVTPPAPTTEPVTVPVSQPAISQETMERLLAFDRVLQDPALNQRVLQSMSPAPVAAPVVPTLPEEIDPQSFEATLWQQQQEINRKLDQVTEVTRQQHKMSQDQAITSAAQTAGEQFATKYADQLTTEEVMEIAQFTGRSGIAGKLAAGSDNLVGSYMQALEHTLWTNPTFRQKMIEAPAPTAATAPGDTQQSQDRKRKLTALSSGSSPVSGAGKPRPPIEFGNDGKLKEKSRMALVQEIASGIARKNNGTF